MEYCVICETYGVEKEATDYIEIFGDSVPVCEEHKDCESGVIYNPEEYD